MKQLLFVVALALLIGCKEESPVTPPVDQVDTRELYFIWNYLDGNHESITVHIANESGSIHQGIVRVDIKIRYATHPVETVSKPYDQNNYIFVLPLQEKNVWGVEVCGYTE